MQSSRFSNVGTYSKPGSASRKRGALFERVRTFFWDYPDKFAPFFEKRAYLLKEGYVKSRPLSPILAVLLCLLVVVVATYYASTLQFSKKRETLIEGVLGMPTNLNAVYLPSFQVQKDVYQLVFDRLFKVLPDGSIQGELAESWEYKEDGKNLHITLNSPIYWHDGVPLTTSDVKFTIELYKSLQGQDSYYDTVSDVEIEIISSSELILKKTRASASFIETITWPILPKHILEQSGMQEALNSNLEDNLIGSGSFKFEEMNEDEIVLTRNDNYWKKAPELESIIFKSYNSEKTLVHALEAGKVDATTEVNPLNVDLLNNIPWIEFDTAPLLRRYWSVYFNFNGPESLRMKQVRQAISASIDRQRIVDEALLGYAKEAKGPIQENSWAYNPDAKRYTYNVEEAKKLFSDAGYSIPEGKALLEKDGTVLEFELAYVSNPIQDKVALIIAENLQAVGVKANLTGLSYIEFRDTRLLSRNFDAILFGVEGLLDPDHFILWHSSQATPPGRNFSSYVSGYKVIEDITRVDDALEKGKSLMDQNLRKDLYYKFQTYLLDEAPAAFLYHPEFIYTHNKTLSGINLDQVTLVEERFDGVEEWRFE